MPHTRSSPHIYYEGAGDEAHPALVLIEGMGAQMIGWRQAFVDRLVDRGLRVIRLDNRDVGLSDMLGGPDDHTADYRLTDMADDVCRVLDELAIGSAHIVGQSMGGAIAQTLAIERGDRVKSLVLIYTAPAFVPEFLGEAILGGSALAPPPASLTREDAVAAYVQGQAQCGSTAYPQDTAWLAEQGGLIFDRGWRPDGALRQASVMMNSGDRRDALGAVTAPCGIIHGRADRLVRAEASIAMAQLMPQAELHLYPGLGHEVHRALWDDFVAIIARTASRA